jgi:hypothetical protein
MPVEKKEGEYVEVEFVLVPKPAVIEWLEDVEGYYKTEAYSS